MATKRKHEQFQHGTNIFRHLLNLGFNRVSLMLPFHKNSNFVKNALDLNRMSDLFIFVFGQPGSLSFELFLRLACCSQSSLIPEMLHISEASEYSLI